MVHSSVRSGSKYAYPAAGGNLPTGIKRLCEGDVAESVTIPQQGFVNRFRRPLRQPFGDVCRHNLTLHETA